MAEDAGALLRAWLAQNDQAGGAPPAAPTTGGSRPDPFDPEPAPIPGALRPGSPDLAQRMDVISRGGRPFDFPATDPNQGTLNQRLGTIATAGNDIVASTLGAPVDAINAALRGQSWLYNTLASPHKPAAGDLVRGGAVPEERPPMTPYQIPYGGSETFRKGYEATVGRTEPKDVTDQLLYGTTAGAASVLPSFAAGRAARYFGASPTTEEFLTGPQTLKGQAGNVGFGAVGGFGSELGQEAAGEDPTARALAALGGGVALPLAVGAGLRYGVQPVREAAGMRWRPYTNALPESAYVDPYATERANWHAPLVEPPDVNLPARENAPWLQRAIGPSAESQAGRILNTSIDDRLEALRRFDPNSPVPGVDRFFAQATRGDPGAVKLEAQVVSQQKPGEGTPEQQALATRAQDQAKAMAAELRNIADPTAPPAGTVQQTMRDRNTDVEISYNQQLADQRAQAEAAQQAQTQATTGLGQPAPRIEDLGATNKVELEAAKQASKARAAALPGPDPATPTNNLTVASRANEILNRLPPEAKVPEGEEGRIFGNVRMWGTSVPFESTNTVRSDILEEIRRQRSQPDGGDTRVIGRLTQLREAIDNNLQAHLPQDQYDLWRARQDAFREHAETYKNQFVGPLLDVRPAGDYRVAATATPAKVIANNESAQAFLNAGGTPETLRENLVTDLHSGGEITPERLATWRDKREGAIRAIPGLGDELNTVAGAQAAVTARAGELAATEAAAQQAQQESQRGILGRVLGVQPSDVQRTVGELVTSKTGATELMKIRQQIAGDPAAEAALSAIVHKHVADTFIDKLSGRIDDRSGFLDFVDTGVPALQAAGVTPESIQRLQALAAEIKDATPPGTRATVGVTGTGAPSTRPYSFQQMADAAKSMAKSGSKSFAVGGTMGTLAGLALQHEWASLPYFAAAGTVGRGIYQTMKNAGIENRNQMLAAMLDNPEYGRAMMMKVTPANEPFIEKAVRASLQGQAATLSTGYDREKLRKDLAEQERRRLQPAMSGGGVPMGR